MSGTFKICEHFREKDNWVSGCGFRSSYNRKWKFCPYCGKHIAWLGEEKRNDEINGFTPGNRHK